MTAEHDRLRSDPRAWKRWGPYLAERAWGTVREDYSAGGDAWNHLPHEHARFKAYRWNEDGLGGICDHAQRLCFALALWNGQDPILKERLFGLGGSEGNHGEDVKEHYFYLDSTPTHSYMRMLYKYPQRTFPYEQLVHENAGRGREQREFELADTGVFDENRYWDVFIEYAKANEEDIFIKLTAHNRGPDAATLTLLPTLWFRNTWSWAHGTPRPMVRESRVLRDEGQFVHVIGAQHNTLGAYELFCKGAEELLFTENDTNVARLYGTQNPLPFVKDGFNEYVIHGNHAAINADRTGTKAAALYRKEVAARGSIEIMLRLARVGGLAPDNPNRVFVDFAGVFAQRLREADAFYDAIATGADGSPAPSQPAEPVTPGPDRSLHESTQQSDLRNIQRQAFAGMLWSKQWYHFDVSRWLQGDPAQPPPPAARKHGRNREWFHLYNAEVISMPDKWEYPWYASWDLAFHCIPLALVDAEFAKGQLDLLTREWYQHPNGQIPAYEWNFSDVNPPVFGWAAWRVFQIDRKQRRHAKQDDPGDLAFLERVFHKLLINFTWWVNRKDAEGNNVFQGGFLGLDNIGVFDRSAPLPTGGRLEQSDGTSWMGMYCLNLMKVALELAQHNATYEDIASKFFEHFLHIAGAMNNISGDGIALWDNEDEFFYDVLRLPGGAQFPLRLRSMVGLIPLFAVEAIEPDVLDKLPGFKARMEWFLRNRPELAALISRWEEPGLGARRLVALTRGHRLKRLLKRMLDPAEFLSDCGVRALSKYHEANPYVLRVNGDEYTVRYEPGESRSALFGGNSNWRGPVWFPMNFLLIESLQKFHHYFGDDFKVECPTGSGTQRTLNQISHFLSARLLQPFMQKPDGTRPLWGNFALQTDPHWRGLLLFHEYFHGDSGEGLGASHQTGWTGLVAKLAQALDGEHR